MRRRLKGAIAAAAAAILLTTTLIVWNGCAMPKPRASKEQTAALTRRTVTAAGYRIQLLQSAEGDQPRFVFVHGTPGNAAGWADFLVEPEDGSLSVAIDRPGFGASEPRGSVPSLMDQARALEPLLGAHQPILVGHSLGGPIVVAAALEYPDRVGAIVILAGSMDPGLERVPAIQYVGDWRAVRWILPRAIRNSNQELIPLKGELLSLEKRLSELRVPVIIVHGTKDELVPYSNVEFMQRLFPPGTIRHVETVEGAGHFLPWEHEATIRAMLKRAVEAAQPDSQ